MQKPCILKGENRGIAGLAPNSRRGQGGIPFPNPKNKQKARDGMKFFHLADLHLGKLLHEFPLLDDQRHILGQVVEHAKQERPDAVLVAGDVFDRSVASAEALRMFDHFLVALSELRIPVFVVAGNHDSADRLAFGARLMQGSGVHIARAFSGKVETHTLEDEHGKVDICLLPFTKPASVRDHFPGEQVRDWTQAVSLALSTAPQLPGRRRVLVAHQFVTGGLQSDSEEASVGGADNVDLAAFAGFDYVALGHLHRPQQMGGPAVRYAGSPLKYSFSEAQHNKSLTVVELGQKGEAQVSELPLVPLREVVELRGIYDTVMSQPFRQQHNPQDYVRITLLDEMEQVDAAQKLRLAYPNLCALRYENTRSQSQGGLETLGQAREEAPFDLFATLYEEQNGQPMNQEQRDFLLDLIQSVWEETP